MKIKYECILCILFLGVLFTPSVKANVLKIDKFSMPVKMGNRISQPVNITFAANGKWRLLVQPLENKVCNQDAPNYSIPIQRLELAELGGRVISNFDIGKVMEVRTGVSAGLNSVNVSLNALTYDSDKPGSYTADIKFTLINETGVTSEEIYNFRFTQNEIAKIDFTNKIVNLKLSKDKILQKNSSQNLDTPIGLYVTSNKNWKLYIRDVSNAKNNDLKYFVRVMSGDRTINCRLNNEHILIGTTPILLASGPSTINSSINSLDKKLIHVDYMIRGPTDKFIKAGSTSNEFEYRLETEN